jgi:uncharacterized protein (TIGR03437 family)
MKLSSLFLFAALAPALAQAPQPPPTTGIIKAGFANVIKLNAYIDNWCMIYINGKLAATDAIEFLPHNVVSVNILPVYPLTIAVFAKDNADPATGLEYGTQIGDGGFILKLADGTVTSAQWKAKVFFKGPLNSDILHPTVQYTPIPANWFAVDFDDSDWPSATEFTEAQVKPDGDYGSYDFTGAKFIWSSDLNLDNTVIFRYTAQAPPNWTKTWNADGDFNISNIVTEAKMAITPAPTLFAVNGAGLATGYVTRVRGGVATSEQFVQQMNGAATALPVDLGPDTDQVYLVLYGSNLGSPQGLTATLGGVSADVTYAGPLQPFNGVDQFNIAVPRSLAGGGNVELLLKSGSQSSNAVNVTIK